MIDALDIHVKGIVQGVGFRPFVYRLARKYLINGWVLNSVDGVHIHAEGESKHVDEFVMELADNAPAAAKVKEIEIKEVPIEPFSSFEIRFSDDDSAETTFVSPDLAICDQCAGELFDREDRRYRYPFINCTNCGPRFTIIDKLPYDRPNTSMAKFAMCSACELEYDTPTDRRFHAQPNACFECGPHISWTEDAGKSVKWGLTPKESDAIFARAVKLLAEGKIIAVKGLGGFHLACDATNAAAVATLRERKRRYGKAFAVMVSDVRAARALCEVNDEEAALLTGSVRPIVLLKKRGGEPGCVAHEALAEGVADGLPELGVMLPYTPVQMILMHDFAKAYECGLADAAVGDAEVAGGATTRASGSACAADTAVARESGSACAGDSPRGSRVAALVMTSGNMHDDPICISDEDAYKQLADIADAFLGNDREILSRFDDSVVRVIEAGGAGKAIQMIRRARGYAPTPISFAAPDAGGAADRVIFATGPEQKNTFTLLRLARDAKGAQIAESFVSQHIGDMENAEAFQAWLETKNRIESLFELVPNEISCDLHPEYITTKWAHEQAALKKIALSQVQHHHAHIASVLAENGMPPTEPICGIAFDGTGFGADGNIWGGEVLLANMGDYERFANFAYVPMPGGGAAVKHPLQMAYGVLWEFDLLDHPGARTALDALGKSQCEMLDAMIEQGINTPVTSSVGRLFDAASALLGICTDPTYEGEPAIMLEAAITCDGQSHSKEDGALVAGEADGAKENDVAGEADGAKEANGAMRSADATISELANAQQSADSTASQDGAYHIGIVKNTASTNSTAHDTSVVLFDAAPLFESMLDDMEKSVDKGVIARKFHDAFVEAVSMAAQLVAATYDVTTVALTGGVFMNRYLVEKSIAALEGLGLTVAINRELPPNDGCVSFGEAVVSLFAR